MFRTEVDKDNVNFKIGIFITLDMDNFFLFGVCSADLNPGLNTLFQRH